MQPKPHDGESGPSLSKDAAPGLGEPVVGIAVTLSPIIRQAQEAFCRDLPGLLQDRKRSRPWVAYHGAVRIALGSSKRELYQVCLRRGLQLGEFLVRRIAPQVPREVDALLDV
jgi:hypothetical protein